MLASQPGESTMLQTKFARRLAVALIAAAALGAAHSAAADSADDDKLLSAGGVVREFTADDERSIPLELLARARGIAVIPGMYRAGFFVGGRRGRGVLTVRTSTGGWSNPSFITLTGGNIGLQFGAEKADVVLVFANDRSVKHIADGKFTLGGDATAIAGPMGKRTTAAVTGRSEVYIYTRSHGVYAGAAFEGARLDIDEEGNQAFYGGDDRAALSAPGAGTPASASRYLQQLAAVTSGEATPGPSGTKVTSGSGDAEGAEQAIIYPIDDAPK
jgi:lipid-binding SYLF domain-containing protein